MKGSQPWLPDQPLKLLKLPKIKFEDIPTDCLSPAFLPLTLELTSSQILDLFTVSKQFYRIIQDPSIRSQLFHFLFSAEIGKQIPFKKEQTWKNYFKLFSTFSDLSSSYLSHPVKNEFGLSPDEYDSDGALIPKKPYSIQTIQDFISKNQLICQINSNLVSSVDNIILSNGIGLL